ncbi:hypothetical protein [Magnetospira thiophila]
MKLPTVDLEWISQTVVAAAPEGDKAEYMGQANRLLQNQGLRRY